MAFFLQRIRELNEMIDKRKISIEKNEQGIAILKPDALKAKLTFYQDGFTLNEGDLRKYGLPLNVRFLKDIYDGFFPSEFKIDYPDGLKLSVEDKRINDFHGKARKILESARGYNNSSPNYLGNGDGLLRIRIHGFPDLEIHTEKEHNIRKIRKMIETKFQIENFELCDPVNGNSFEDESTMDQNKLYPKGIITVIQSKK